jgi:hypothetical protein
MIIRFKLKRIKKLSIPVFILFILTLQIQSVYAWDNCPFGEINESYPGTCGRYTDTDNDNICDLSQLPPELRVETQDNNSNFSNDIGDNSKSKSGISYYFVPIAVLLFSIYLITLYLSRKKKIKISQHRKIWNFILLITFLVSGIFGIILAIIVSYGIRLSFYSDLLFWHVEFGIAMAIISIFHISWYIKYFKKMFQIKK